MSDKKTKRTLSLKELSGNKKTETEKCPSSHAALATTVPFATHEDMVHVTSRLDALQASIDRLLDMCLQVEPDDSSAVVEDF